MTTAKQSLVTEYRPKCLFGRTHTLAIGLYDDEGEFHDDLAKCWTCGQVEVW